jgi:O-antigen/teichoic acid export membrane protein
MIKSFLKNSLIYTIGTILTRGISIILVPIYTRYLSPDEYGIIDLFMILTSIVSLTIALEIHQAVVRFYQDTTDEDEKMQYVSSAFVFSIFVYSLYFIISYIFSDTFTLLILDDVKYQNIFLLASGAIATGGLFYFTSGQLRWQMLPKQSVIVSIVHVLIVASIAVYLLMVRDMKVESIFVGQIFGNIFGIFLSIYYAKKSYRFVFVYEKFKEMVLFSYPLVFSGGAIFVSLYIDRIAIKDLLGLEDLGIYGIAYRFATVASLVMMGFQSSLSPLIYKHYKEEKTAKNIAKLFDGFIIFALFVVSGSILFSKEVIVLMSTEAYYNAAILIPLLVMAVFFSNMYIFAPGMGIAKKTKTIALISASGAIINTVLNYTMIPIFGLIGASISTLISAIVVFYLRVVLSNKYYNIEYGFVKKIFIFLFVLGSSYFVNTLYGIGIVSFIIKTIFLFLISLLVVYLILEASDLKKVKKLKL